MSQKCKNQDCNRECFINSDQCVLHCEKKSYSEDRDNHSILYKFNQELIDYIINSIILQTYKYAAHPGKEMIRKYLEQGQGEDGLVEFCRSKVIVFTEIFFPCYDDRDPFDYSKTLSKLGKIHFNYCKFSATSLHIEQIEVFYQDCIFFQFWSISDTGILEDESNVIYQKCIFKNQVSVSGLEDKTEINVSLFSDCQFEKKLDFESINLKQKIFSNTDDLKINIPVFRMTNCIVNDHFILNDLVSTSMLITNTTFNKSFEIKNSEISNFCEFINTNFEGLFEAYTSKFGGFESFQCVFKDVVGFEHCQFSENKQNKEHMAVFKYTTFLSFTNFRNSTFHLGLDLENSNLKEAPNFLNIHLYSDNTNRETLRIIKNSFDRIGNHIEANQFFVKEMKKYKQELRSKKGNQQEKIILWFNQVASNFGQNYIYPILWILFFAVIYSGLIYAQENNWLYRICPSANIFFEYASSFFNGIAKNIIPFKSFAKEGMEFLSLIFYIIFASLIWQTIIAFKRHTKR